MGTRLTAPTQVVEFLFGEVLDADVAVLRGTGADELVELRLDGAPSPFCEFWIRNTIRKITMVVLVLMTSSHVSEKWKYGPLTAQATTEAVPECEGEWMAGPLGHLAGEVAEDARRCHRQEPLRSTLLASRVAAVCRWPG